MTKEQLIAGSGAALDRARVSREMYPLFKGLAVVLEAMAHAAPETTEQTK